MIRLAFVLCLLATPLAAVEPHEMLSDPTLEARAQALDEELRCIRCRSENIASSQADWAADARVLVRELVAEGSSDEEVLDHFVARYGEYVLMRPKASGRGLVLWLAPLVLLAAGGLTAVLYLRRRSEPDTPEGLSPEEEARLRDLTQDQ